ncbi:MAG: META domain-containing protein [Cetobacterium sp.]|uniref:META domain-containing protein n=1 Tax=Cetobacterium sp. TaxID=2071632 RepID=UPI003F3E20AC
MIKKSIYLFLLVVFFMGCSALKNNKKDLINLQEIYGKTFYLEKNNNLENMTITLDGDRIYGFSGVNRYFGSFEEKGNKIIIGSLASTRMGGSPEEMNREREFLQNLEGEKIIVVINNQLQLIGDNNKVMKFILKEGK